MKKNLIIGSILLGIGIILSLVFLSDFLIMVLGASVYYFTTTMGSTIFLIGIFLILISIRPLLKDMKNAIIISGLVYISLSVLLLILGFVVGKDLFLSFTSWDASIIFANIMGEVLLMYGALFFLYGIMIFLEGLKLFKLILGISIFIVGLVLLLFGSFFFYSPPYATLLTIIIVGLLQGYYIFGLMFIIFGILIIIKRKK